MPHARRSAQFGTWSAPQCPFQIEYDLDILDEIGREVEAGRARGGREVGGLLFGTFDRERLRILGYEPLECSHAFGPSFRLSDEDRGRLAVRLAADEGEANSAYYVVGWYHSHLGGGPAFSDEDVALHDRYFPEPWHIILLERPGLNGRSRTGFFFREPGAEDPAEAVPAIRIPVAPRPVPERAVHVAQGHSRAVWTVLAAMLALCAAAILYLRFEFPASAKPQPGLVRVEAVKRYGIVEVSWDKVAVSGAKSGRLEVRDGDLAGQIPLDGEALAYGRLPYRQTSDIARFRLVVERPDGVMMQGSTTFVRPDPGILADSPPASEPVAAAQAEAPVVDPGAAPAPEPVSIQDLIRAQALREGKPVPPEVATPRKFTPPSAAEIAAGRPKAAEPAPPRLEPPADAIQTAQLPRVTVPMGPVSVPGPPAPTPVAPATTPVPAISKPPLHLSGRWVLQPGGYSRSPAVPESLAITVNESGGAVQGTLEGRYRSRSKTDRIHFSFSGKLENGNPRFTWATVDGHRSEIEFIPVSNSADVIEVVWQSAGSKQVFDEMLKRVR